MCGGRGSRLDASGEKSPADRTVTALMRVRVDKDALPDEVAVVIAQYGDDEGGEDGLMVFPLAIVATADVFAALTPPVELTVEEGNE